MTTHKTATWRRAVISLSLQVVWDVNQGANIWEIKPVRILALLRLRKSKFVISPRCQGRKRKDSKRTKNNLKRTCGIKQLFFFLESFVASCPRLRLSYSRTYVINRLFLVSQVHGSRRRCSREINCFYGLNLYSQGQIPNPMLKKTK